MGLGREDHGSTGLKLLGGPFRDGCPMYFHGDYLKDMHDMAAVKDWVQKVNALPESFKEINIDQAFRVSKPFHASVQPAEMRRFIAHTRT